MAITETIPPRKVTVDGATAPATTAGLRVTAADCLILHMLDETGGYLTRRVAELTVGAGRRNTASVGQDLQRLAICGLVEPLDGGSPVCWRRTPAGTRMLARACKVGLFVPGDTP